MVDTRLPTFVGASQPDIVLAKQKDAHYQNKVTETVVEAADSLLGAHTALTLRPELELLSEAVYNGSTTLVGKQTPGEEYCDLIQVTEDRVKVPSIVVDTRTSGNEGTGPSSSSDVYQVIQSLAPISTRRTPLVLLNLLIPYFRKRWKAGGWKPLLSAFSPQTAHERAAAFREQLRRRQLGTRSNENDEKEQSKAEPDAAGPTAFLKLLWKRLLKILGSFRQAVPRYALIIAAAGVLSQFHLAVFYLNGTYFDIASRITGIRYIFTKEPDMGRPSYRILGMFLITQLLIQLGIASSAYMTSFRNTYSALVDRIFNRTPVEASAHSPDGEKPYELVPSKNIDVVQDENECGEELAGRCGICLSLMTDPACPPCGHVYCYECIMESVLSRAECPTCRQKSLPQSIACIYFRFRLNT